MIRNDYRRRHYSPKKPTDWTASDLKIYTVLLARYASRFHVDSQPVINLFLYITTKMKRETSLVRQLAESIAVIEKQGYLHEEESDGESSGSGVKVRKYKEDRCIDVSSPAGFTDDASLFMYVARFYSFGDHEIFRHVIYTTLFGGDKRDDKEDSVPASYIKEITTRSKKLCISSFFNFTGKEALLAYIIYLTENITYIANLESCIDDNEQTLFFAVLSGLSEVQTRRLLNKNGKLLRLGIVETSPREDRIFFTQDATDCIKTNDTSFFYTNTLAEYTGTNFDLSSFSVPKTETEVALSLLKETTSANILLYGAPGAGKTEFAKALARNSITSEGRILLFKNEDELQNVNKSIYRLNRLCTIPGSSRDIIIVDEADSILETAPKMSLFGSDSSELTGPINRMLEESHAKIIWIVNRITQIEESTKRRFTFSLCFGRMTDETVRNIARNRIEKIALKGINSENGSDREIKEKLVTLCGDYRLTGASVENMAKLLPSLDFSDEDAAFSGVQKVFEANSKLLFGKAKLREHPVSAYAINALNTSVDAQEIVDMVKNAQEFSSENPGTENGVRILCYGVSGTGKTEFARYLSQLLHKPILLKRASDIFGMYVGENEANIRQAFNEAEASGQILLFDEADSFFANRADAAHSWERSTTNEFLTQMEEFKGILICTTNLKQIMDPAMNRRFHICVEFKPPVEQGIKILCESYFPRISFSDEQIRSLARPESLTPGDFGSLYSRLRFMDKEARNSSEYITEELIRMQDEKEGRRRIGF